MIKQNTIGSGLIFIIILTFCINIRISGCEDKEVVCSRIFNLIYNQQFEEAGTELARVRFLIDEAHYQILLLDLSWWKALSSNGEDDFRKFEEALKNYTTVLSEKPDKDRLQELICLSYSLRWAAMKKRHLEMMLYIFKIEYNIGQLKTNELTQEQLDYFSIFNSLHNIMKADLYLYRGSLRTESILTLKRYFESSNIEHRVISCYFLAKVYTDIMNAPQDAIGFYEELSRLYPDNQIFAYNLNHCRMAVGLR